MNLTALRLKSPSGPTLLALITLSGVVLSWLVFAALFLVRRRPRQPAEAKRDRSASLGIFLQMCAYFFVFFQPPWQPFLPPVASLSGRAGIMFCGFTVGLAVASGWLIESAVRTLGKQWALPARLVEDHKLVT